ncbi:CoA ester lyase [Leifsonia sp. YAF41]|uniref:HpcH/HpaI aldolase/citrate lyase family protein n=1 Tax=Leifsonia sp. YAF41 TaxID=3233086 RepID=UPI003F96CBF1
MVPAPFALGPALLFCPADRPDRYGRAVERADAVIIDLEDAVAPANRTAAREALIAHPQDPARTIVRVNALGTPDHELDLLALQSTGYRTIMVPKAESAAALAAQRGFQIIALCESAAGVIAAAEIAAVDTVVALMWGAEDLIASLGGTSSRRPDGSYRDVARHARSQVLLAAGAHGKVAIDTVHLDIADLAGVAREAEDAAASGFGATACIHPSQVEPIRGGYRPTEAQITAATDILRVAQSQPGVFQHHAQMVDAPLLRHAEAVLQRAGIPLPGD